MKRQKVTLKDVAKLANVAPITVSRAFLTPEKLNPETFARIERAVRKSGYVRNRLAGGLVSKRTQIIAAVVPTIDNPAYGKTLQGLSEVLRAKGYYLMVASSGVEPAGEEELVRTLLSYRPDGIFLHNVVHSTRTRRLLKQAGIPIVEAGDIPKNPLDMVVSYSNYASALDLTCFLGRRGYRRIGFVCNDISANSRAYERYRGYIEGLRTLGLEPDPALVQTMPLGFKEGAEALGILVERCPDVDAIFFGAEMWATGALLECQRRGWDVPGRIGIAGYDDQRLSPSSAGLTAIRLPRLEIGQRAGKMLLCRLDNDPLEQRFVDLGYELAEGITA